MLGLILHSEMSHCRHTSTHANVQTQQAQATDKQAAPGARRKMSHKGRPTQPGEWGTCELPSCTPGWEGVPSTETPCSEGGVGATSTHRRLVTLGPGLKCLPSTGGDPPPCPKEASTPQPRAQARPPPLPSAALPHRLTLPTLRSVSQGGGESPVSRPSLGGGVY